MFELGHFLVDEFLDAELDVFCSVAQKKIRDELHFGSASARHYVVELAIRRDGLGKLFDPP